MSFWTDVFTLETWAQARQRDYLVSGFPPPTPGSGGYSQRTFEKVGVGDVLLCYCKKPARRWVGALRVRAPMYMSSEPVWGIDGDGKVRYPARFDVEPLVALDPAIGVDGAEAAGKLECLAKYGQNWWAFLQRSLNRVPDEDGALMLELLRQEREPQPFLAGRIRSYRGLASEESSLLDARSTPAREAIAAPEEEQATRIHTEIQGKLRDIGFKEGFDVWIADAGSHFGTDR